MRVIGIDPGISCTGYAVIEYFSNGDTLLVELGVIKTSPKAALADRLITIYEGINEVIVNLSPDRFAVESVFVGKNVQSALKLGHARGAAIIAGAKNRLPVSEYSPREVKQNITGNGNASKEQVQFMIQSILKLEKFSGPNDASDAAAVALSYIQGYKFDQMIKPKGK